MPINDSFIAATAMVHGPAAVMGNHIDFAKAGMRAIDPVYYLNRKTRKMESDYVVALLNGKGRPYPFGLRVFRGACVTY